MGNIFMNKHAILLFAAVSLMIGHSLYAQETYELNEIVISGGNTPILRNELATSHTIISKQEIEQSSNKSLSHILRNVPGLAVSSAGTATTQIRIRGGEGNHTLVLIDGVEATGGDGEYFLSGLSTSNVERIEIMRGPQTVFFGPAASSGVINIITTAPSKNEYSTAILGTGKSDRAEFLKSFLIGKTQNLISFSHEKDNGHDYSYSNGDKDGFERETLQWKMHTQTDTGTNIKLNIRSANEEYDYDDTVSWPVSATSHLDYLVDSNDQGKRNEKQLSIRLKKSFTSGRSAHEVGYRETRYSSSTTARGKTSDNNKKSVKYHYQKALDKNQLSASKTLGSFILEGTDDKNILTPEHQRTASAHAYELRHKFKNSTAVQFGLRSESSNKYATANTWKIGVSKPLRNQNSTISFDAGTGVVNPTYCEIYGGTACFGSKGNSNIKPEKNTSYTIGLNQKLNTFDGVFSLAIFKETLTDEITAGPAPNFYPTNAVGKSNRHGTEISLDIYPTEKIFIKTNYTYLISRDANKNIEVRRPRHILDLIGRYQFSNNINFAEIALKHVANNMDSYPVNWAAKKMPDYTTVNIKTGLEIKNIAFNTEVSNLFDVNNSDVWGYRNPGRSIFFTAKKTW